MTPQTLPDTGSRSQFETGAVRDACAGKGLPSRIPPEAIRRLAKRYEDGESKYPDADGVPNWMRGIPLSRYFDSAMRHLLAAAEGDDTEDHLGAVLWNAAGWIWTADAIADGRLPDSLDDLPFKSRPAPSIILPHDDDVEAWEEIDDGQCWSAIEVDAEYGKSDGFDEIEDCRGKAGPVIARWDDGFEAEVPPLPDGYDTFWVVPHGQGPGPDGFGFFWRDDSKEPCSGWLRHEQYKPGAKSDLYWVNAEKSVKPGDRVLVVDADGPGEPYEFTSIVESVSESGIVTTHSSAAYRRDQVTVLPAAP